MLHNNLLGCRGRDNRVVTRVYRSHINLLRISLSLNDNEILIVDLRLLLSCQLLSLLHVIGLHVKRLRVRDCYRLRFHDWWPVASI